jgi:peroxiredoxin
VVPPISLASSDDASICVDITPEGAERLVLYAFPRIGRPDEGPLSWDWDVIPGARGCTPEACAFRDHAADLWRVGAAVMGISTQDAASQREAADRLHLPFPLVSDAELALTHALDLPTFGVAGHVLLKRLTLVVRNGIIEHVFYPVFPPDSHPTDVLDWLRDHPVSAPPSLGVGPTGG